MIMRDRVPCRLAFGAKLVVALMAVAAVPAWTLGQSKPKVASDEREITVRVEDGVAVVTDSADGVDEDTAKAIEAQIRALSQKLEALKAAKAADAQKKATEKLKAAQGQLGEKLKELHVQVDANNPSAPKIAVSGARVLTSGQDGIKVIGPDGKEIQGAKVIIGGSGQGGTYTVKPLTVGGTTPEGKKLEYRVVGGEPKAATVVGQGTARNVYEFKMSPGGGNAITLSRATYKLNKDQAAALSTLLGAVKATVMETKVDGDSLTVTTTPEVQQTIRQIVGLLQGPGGTTKFEWHVTPGQNLFVPAVPPTPAVPATPAAPRSRPASPDKKPGTSEKGPEQVDVKAILDQLKTSGAVHLNLEGNPDMLKLQEMLKTLKPLELKLKTEKDKLGEKKPDGEK